jgi:hypothetical protein
MAVSSLISVLQEPSIDGYLMILGVKWFGYPDLNADGSIRNMNQVCRLEEYLKPFVRFEALRP